MPNESGSQKSFDRLTIRRACHHLGKSEFSRVLLLTYLALLLAATARPRGQAGEAPTPR